MHTCLFLQLKKSYKKLIKNTEAFYLKLLMMLNKTKKKTLKNTIKHKNTYQKIVYFI